MRSISLVQKIEFSQQGSVFQNAVCFTDVDNDGQNELCVCNTAGDLVVFKGIQSTKPWKVNKNTGCVVVLCGGAVQTQHNVLCALDADGTCSLFDVCDGSESCWEGGQNSGPFKPSSRASSPSRNGELRLIHREKLAPNPKCAMLFNIDNDDSAELIVGSTDRFVRIYKWQDQESDSEIIPAPAPTSQHREPLVKQGSKEIETERKPTLSFTLSLSKDSKVNSSAISDDVLDSPKNQSHDSSCHTVGNFVVLKQFSLLAQLGSLAICKSVEGLNQLIVSQPNGGYSILEVYDNDKAVLDAVDTPSSLNSPNLPKSESFPAFFPIHAKTSKTNNHTSTEIVGGICRGYQVTGVLGICTQDGHFMTLENTNVINSNPVKNMAEHSWFCMSKLDFNNNGDDEIVLCSMDGMTYIVDKMRDIVSFDFNENVAAFQAGYYGSDESKSSPCLCYVTLHGKISLYYNVFIKTMKVKCVHGALIEMIKQRNDLNYLLDMFKLPNGEINHQKIQNLVKQIWSKKK